MSRLVMITTENVLSLALFGIFSKAVAQPNRACGVAHWFWEAKGAGKTTLLCERIAQLVARGVVWVTIRCGVVSGHIWLPSEGCWLASGLEPTPSTAVHTSVEGSHESDAGTRSTVVRIIARKLRGHEAQSLCTYRCMFRTVTRHLQVSCTSPTWIWEESNTSLPTCSTTFAALSKKLAAGWLAEFTQTHRVSTFDVPVG